MLKDSGLGRATTAAARREIEKKYLPRIERSLELLGDQGIWWRPNAASNSVGNMVLHLEGNVRQWIIAGLGNARDIRKRDLEFSERGPIPRRELARRLRSTVREAGRILARLSPDELRRERTIQGYRTNGLDAVLGVAEHFAYHTGQILYVTKMKLARDPGFTHLPGERRRKNPPRPRHRRRR